MIVIQARSNSKRLPGKIMEEIGGTPIIRHVYNSCTNSGLFTVVAVPTGDKVIEYLKEEHIPYFEGSEDDVLGRFYHCARTFKENHIFRVTADCPLLDHAYILALNVFKNQVAFGCTQGVDGQNVEMFSMELLELAHKEAQGDDREHVTTWMRKYVDKENKPRMIHNIPIPSEKMSVDTQEDLERVRGMYANRHPSN